MRTIRNLLVAVIATFSTFAGASFGTIWTEGQIQQYFADHPGSAFVPANGDILEGDIHIPANVPPVLNAGTYTVEVLQGRTVKFQAVGGGAGGSLTITTQQGQGGNAVGRINAHGAAGNMAVLIGAVGDHWHGIRVESSPGAGNLISYCEVAHAWPGALSGAIFVNGEGTQCQVLSCYIHDGGGAGIRAEGGRYRFQNNEIHQHSFGIYCCNPMEGDGTYLDNAVTNNFVNEAEEHGIVVEGGWNGTIRNNIVYHPTRNAIWEAGQIACPCRIVNNTLDGGDLREDGDSDARDRALNSIRNN